VERPNGEIIGQDGVQRFDDGHGYAGSLDVGVVAGQDLGRIVVREDVQSGLVYPIKDFRHDSHILAVSSPEHSSSDRPA
jgi:hypothetical protein